MGKVEGLPVVGLPGSISARLVQDGDKSSKDPRGTNGASFSLLEILQGVLRRGAKGGSGVTDDMKSESRSG